MEKIIKNIWFGPLFSGLLAFIAICQINFFISWICYIALFISIQKAPPKKTFKKGFVFGLTFSSIAFFWMIPGAEKFTGNSVLYGILVFLISLLFISLYFGFILWVFAALKKREDKSRSVVINSILVASVFCVGEALLMIVSKGLPWFDIHSGNGLADNLYSIQPASLFGIHGLTFMVVFVNYLAAHYLVNRMYLKLCIPLIYVLLFLATGYFLMNNSINLTGKKKPFDIAIVAENIPPDIKWDDNNGNMLVQILLDLNKSAIALKPAMVLWSESAIPWTYHKDDDLVKEILSITSPVKATHILGINSAYTENEVYNSAYCILPDGNVTGRYDKQNLLTLIEKPLNGLLMPFFSSKGFTARNDKENAAPLNTPYGKAGVLICNEAAVPSAAAGMIKQGAEFLVNMSNDGWFDDTYIVRLHFYYARLRAVESRKDIVVNCNNGYSGLIKASGNIIEQERSEEPFVKIASVEPNDSVSLASAIPGLLVYCCAAYLLMIMIMESRSLNPKKKYSKK